MTTSTPRLPSQKTPRAVASELQDVAACVAESLAPATRRAYRAALADFTAWCDEAGVDALPAAPETVARYLAAGAKSGRSVSTLSQRLAAIRWAHEARNYESPTAAKGVRATMAGIRRQLGVAPKRKAPATVDRITAMASHAPNSLKGLRDRAFLLFGFASAMRRSELVALDLTDLEETDRGLLVTVRRSKSDQEGEGHDRAVPFGRAPETCPVTSILSWMEAAGLEAGGVFRSVDRHDNIGESLSTRAAGDIVKHYARLAGLDPDDFGGHSLRAGFVTSAAERGASTERIMDHTGHRSHAMVRVYTRRVDAFDKHAGEGLL
jgi:site-specific recombinase XerD